jgi:hypothetical protein
VTWDHCQHLGQHPGFLDGGDDKCVMVDVKNKHAYERESWCSARVQGFGVERKIRGVGGGLWWYKRRGVRGPVVMVQCESARVQC